MQDEGHVQRCKGWPVISSEYSAVGVFNILMCGGVFPLRDDLSSSLWSCAISLANFEKLYCSQSSVLKCTVVLHHSLFSPLRNPYCFFLPCHGWIYVFREPPLRLNQYEMSKLELYMVKPPKLTALPQFWNVAISNTRMLLFLTRYSLAGIRSWLSPSVGRIGWATGGTWGLMGFMILRYRLLPGLRPHCSPGMTALSLPGDGEGWLFCRPQWPLQCREGKALAGHNGDF